MSLVIQVVIVPMTRGGGKSRLFAPAELRALISVQMPTEFFFFGALARKEKCLNLHRFQALIPTYSLAPPYAGVYAVHILVDWAIHYHALFIP